MTWVNEDNIQRLEVGYLVDEIHYCTKCGTLARVDAHSATSTYFHTGHGLDHNVDVANMVNRCPDCDHALATEEDNTKYQEGEGEHLCWRDFSNDTCEKEPADWRARYFELKSNSDHIPDARKKVWSEEAPTEPGWYPVIDSRGHKEIVELLPDRRDDESLYIWFSGNHRPEHISFPPIKLWGPRIEFPPLPEDGK
jgi:hypothetical protein